MSRATPYIRIDDGSATDDRCAPCVGPVPGSIAYDERDGAALLGVRVTGWTVNVKSNNTEPWKRVAHQNDLDAMMYLTTCRAVLVCTTYNDPQPTLRLWSVYSIGILAVRPLVSLIRARARQGRQLMMQVRHDWPIYIESLGALPFGSGLSCRFSDIVSDSPVLIDVQLRTVPGENTARVAWLWSRLAVEHRLMFADRYRETHEHNMRDWLTSPPYPDPLKKVNIEVPGPVAAPSLVVESAVMSR